MRGAAETESTVEVTAGVLLSALAAGDSLRTPDTDDSADAATLGTLPMPERRRDRTAMMLTCSS
jgi:hypothetical protein